MMELDSGNSKLSFFVAGVLVWAVREIAFAAKKNIRFDAQKNCLVFKKVPA